jgi:DNA-binding PadR family transcriptional regulator
MSSDVHLTPTSFIVLGFIEAAGDATPYDLKQGLEQSAGNFWSIPHSQLYSESERLADAGHLSERRESSGRRRRVYSMTAKGRRALNKWRDEPTGALPELRDVSLLKLFLGGDPAALATPQLDAHRRKLEAYRALASADEGAGPRGPWQALEAGIAHEREWIRFWSKLAA